MIQRHSSNRIGFFLFSLFSLFFFFTASAPNCYSGLYGAVKKYQNSSVDSSQIEKISQYDHLIRYFCNFSYFVPNHKVNADFIRALILAESGADPGAQSDKNALGLAQIIYPTGKKAAGELAASTTKFRYVPKHRLHNLSRGDLHDPAVNILLACYLIAKYNHRFDGRLDLVVSAWNAGEYTDSLSLGRHAPFKETEELIGKINAYYVYLLKHRIFP
jgi:soluble lytic murein transglycosylase-like protein